MRNFFSGWLPRNFIRHVMYDLDRVFAGCLESAVFLREASFLMLPFPNRNLKLLKPIQLKPDGWH